MLGRPFGMLGRGRPEEWRPSGFRLVETDLGANVNYDCYCGCDAGFALDCSVPRQAAESCCCGNLTLVGENARERLHRTLDGAGAYRQSAQELVMAWGESAEVALAIPNKQD